AAVSSTLSSANPAVAAASICQGAVKVPIYSYDLAIAGGTSTFASTTCRFTTAGGSYVSTDVTKFQLWYGTTTLAAATQIGTDIVATLGNGVHNFPAFTSISLATSTTYHFWITTDVAAGAVAPHTIIVSAVVLA